MCGAPGTIPERSDGRCGDCSDWPPGCPPASAPFAYAGSALELVHALKYSGWTGLADPMGRLMAPVFSRLPAADTPVLVPVPLAAARLRERGFNQAEVLARGLGAAIDRDVLLCLERRRSGPAQIASDRADRAGNVSEAFRVLKEIGPMPASAVLVDDVVTTGATARACAAALREAGVRCTGIISFARTLRRIEVHA